MKNNHFTDAVVMAGAAAVVGYSLYRLFNAAPKPAPQSSIKQVNVGENEAQTPTVITEGHQHGGPACECRVIEKAQKLALDRTAPPAAYSR